ncbi:MAG: M20/M25/M40 family metallo-hydrolase [Armatimonadetes bacterium]|nr:M20/M25/M40 family metallo-hydrolase [Armatimonadota bacterium]
MSRRWILIVSIPATLLLGSMLVAYFTIVAMPLQSFSGPLPPLTDEEKNLAAEMRQYVYDLSGEIGERNVANYPKLRASAGYISATLESFGYHVRKEPFQVDGKTCWNLVAEIPGTTYPDIVIVGAHYDTAPDAPGANDNGSGVAATLALARAYAGKKLSHTMRFVFFANEEPPYFLQGSRVYAAGCRARNEDIRAMYSIETIGWYSDSVGSQAYPFPFNSCYPSTGNFIAFVGNMDSRSLVTEAVSAFRQTTAFPSEGASAPGWITGIGWSDHAAFWEQGYQAIMITDTAPFRYPYYHTPFDTPDRLDYDRMARIVHGLQAHLNALTY